MDQGEIWKNLSKNSDIFNMINCYKNPLNFQRELAEMINQHFLNKTKVLEVGCGTAATSYLLNNNFNITVLDYNEDLINKLKTLFTYYLNKNINIVLGDMFNMPFEDKTFDLVFNSGVMEHYRFSERVVLLKEYARVLKDDGLMIIAIPNHYDFAYRLAYLVRKRLLRGRNWPWPEEYKIYDLKNEINEANLRLVNRIIVDKETNYSFIDNIYIRKIIEFVNKNFNKTNEGYLTVLTISK
ncbi:class I SAM-dependent methyltransferase [Carboxydothermus hydrogenoformans]|uniref:Methyltransferase type 11 domain-containing protein n=1 Tax=Carboxydothermus hydrogenoformans (strain ATCC BAA-161 / DSM 6008 / Z-2901) TaxID=246194 RepID=Q3AD86_CARHZ|nr:class I SAM-dependent methyltransferase [Carboxydothermus hydrogenoformans]ABB14471.1 conserved hypothetical protein [Carboxydothermus hydrogenoformans Z-2901]